MDALSKYKAKDVRDAENIVERITPRLQHANCAVVLSAVKVLFHSAAVVVPVLCAAPSFGQSAWSDF